MAYLCVIGLFLLTAFVVFCWLLGSLADTMSDDTSDILD